MADLEWENRKEDFYSNLIAREGGGKPVRDSGGWTKFGISEKAHGKDYVIFNLDEDTAKDIYRKHYTKRGEERFGKTPEALKFMDMEVNMGYGNAMKVAQRALNSLLPENEKITVDGGYGSKTKKAIATIQENFSSQIIINAIKDKQRNYYNFLEDADKYPGWEARSSYDPIKES